MEDICCAADRLRAAQDGGAAVKWLEERLTELLEWNSRVLARCQQLPAVDVKRFGNADE
jgi:hypothetical protein